MLTVDKLKSFGADTKDGIERCMGNEELYLRLASAVPDQDEFDKLYKSASSGDLAAAFEAAHALKGVLGNLSLTPLYIKMCEITELLRKGEDIDYTPLLSDIGELHTRLKELGMEDAPQ